MAVPTTLALGSHHQLTPLCLAILWPQAHTCQREAPWPGSMRQPWDPAQHSSSQHLWASSVSFPWREKWRGPAWPLLPLSVGTAGSGGRCQDRAVCVKWVQLGWVWAELDMGKGFQSVWQGGNHHTKLHGHQHGVLSVQACVTCNIRDVSFGAGAPLGPLPCPSGHWLLAQPARGLEKASAFASTVPSQDARTQ